MRLQFTFVFAVAGLCLPAFSGAQLIASRGDLNSILGGGGTTDNFEMFTGLGTGAVTGPNYLDSTTIWDGQGPGLVNPGASYQAGSSTLQWNGMNYFGQNSQDILSDNQTLTVAYTGFVQAMGVDLSSFSGYGDTFNMTVYNAAGAVIGTDSIVDNGTSGQTEFFGWYAVGGIAAVTFTSGNNPWSPIIDNHTYGGAVPEPGSMLALGVGALALVARRRRNRA